MIKGKDLIENTMEDEQAKFEDAIAQVEVADTLVNNIRNPAIRSMINALKAVMRVPFIGDLIDSSISTTFEDNQKKKRDQLINIILSDKQRITKDMVNNVEFIVNFARVMDAVNRLAKNEKVEYFANLIRAC